MVCDHTCAGLQTPYFRCAIIAYLIFDKWPFAHAIIARVTVVSSKIACANIFFLLLKIKFVDFGVSQLPYMLGMKQDSITFHIK